MKRTVVFLFALIPLIAACVSVSQTQQSLPNANKTFVSTQSASALIATSTLTSMPLHKTSQQPTKLPSITSSNTPISHNPPELTSTTVPTTVQNSRTPVASPSGRIYTFDDVAYGYLDPQAGLQSSINPLRPKSPDVIGPTGAAIAFAFSYYSQQVAYITNGNEGLKLWIGDLGLQDVETIWTDEKKWLNYDEANYDEIEIRWGLHDNSIILVNRMNIVVLSLQDKTATQLSGKCTWISISPKTGQFAIWYPVNSGKSSYVVIERDGTQWDMSSLPENFIIAEEWVSSPNGDRVLYATGQGELVVVDKAWKQFVLPVSYVPPRWDITMRVLQWSRDGDRILIYGYDQRKGLCPTDTDKESPCWFLLDAKTSDFIWWPTGNLAKSDFDATLSPDGEWIILFVMVIPDRYGYVVSTSTNEAIRVFNWVLSPVSWSK